MCNILFFSLPATKLHSCLMKREIADFNFSSLPFSITGYPALEVKRALEPVTAAKVGHTYFIAVPTKRDEQSQHFIQNERGVSEKTNKHKCFFFGFFSRLLCHCCATA